jgi:hypothetical protein
VPGESKPEQEPQQPAVEPAVDENVTALASARHLK